jgi:hypothetical protein
MWTLIWMKFWGRKLQISSNKKDKFSHLYIWSEHNRVYLFWNKCEYTFKVLFFQPPNICKVWKKLLNIFFKSYWSKTKLNSVAFSPQANYADRATAACGRSKCQLLRIKSYWSTSKIACSVPNQIVPCPIIFIVCPSGLWYCVFFRGNYQVLRRTYILSSFERNTHFQEVLLWRIKYNPDFSGRESYNSNIPTSRFLPISCEASKFPAMYI